MDLERLRVNEKNSYLHSLKNLFGAFSVANGRNGWRYYKKEVTRERKSWRDKARPQLLLTVPGGEVRSVQRSRTQSGSPLLAPEAQLTWFLPLGTRAGSAPEAKTPFPLPPDPRECLSHPSTSLWCPADTLGRLGPQWPTLKHKVSHWQLSQSDFGVKIRYENYTFRDQNGKQRFMLDGVITLSGTLHTTQWQGLFLIVQSPSIGLLESAFNFHFIWEEKKETGWEEQVSDLCPLS